MTAPKPKNAANNLSIAKKKEAPATASASKNELTRKLLSGGFLLHVGVENGQPIVAFFFPDRAGVHRAGSVFPVISAFHFDRVSRDDNVLFIRERFETANGERFHVPLFH